VLVGGGGIELEVGEGAGCCGGVSNPRRLLILTPTSQSLAIIPPLLHSLTGVPVLAEWVMMAVFLGTIGSLRLFLGDLSQVVPGPVHWREVQSEEYLQSAPSPNSHTNLPIPRNNSAAPTLPNGS
jgi:hypothetical protein